ncbi:MBL fold metallo-hydrolase [Hamadaea tsunoensis]|uniref:MBL fold metallo-hydrolase n=1 Tax=Hamadaea tsunoensis TaxID=53368 RepID=UPI0003F5C671|nr:MBL fold metallo-hydrolase [Hamadaea tsunoensis]
MITFHEIADRVYLATEPMLRVNVTLVVGDGQALVIDTLSIDDHARQLLEGVRTVTPYPLTLVNTHHHFDHSFGNAVLSADGAPIWGHETAARHLRERGPVLQRGWYEEALPSDLAFADALGRVTIVPPGHTFHTESTLDVGGRAVTLRHLGLGHTDGDLVAEIPDAAVVVAGDLIEEGAAPGFGDAYPISWPDTLAGLLALVGPSTRVVPGHGTVVDLGFVRAQHDELTALSWLIREGHRDGADPAQVAAKASLTRFGERGLIEAQHAVTRGFLELDAAL